MIELQVERFLRVQMSAPSIRRNKSEKALPWTKNSDPTT
jgi:hypothetical protein